MKHEIRQMDTAKFVAALQSLVLFANPDAFTDAYADQFGVIWRRLATLQ